MTRSSVCILCGSIGSGKTTTLLRLLERLSPTLLVCRGILCPPVIEAGTKTGIDLIDVSTRESTRLAELNRSGEKNLATRGWKFDAQAVQRGNEILRNATPCDVLFVDELGPLEYKRGEGLMEGFPALNSRAFQLAFITIRPSLLSAALGCWPDALVFDLNQVKQDALVQELLDILDQTIKMP